MPELNDIYNEQKERKKEKYDEDCNISGMDREFFCPFKPQPELVTRMATKVKPNDRSSMLLYLKTQDDDQAKRQVIQEVKNLKALRKSRYFNKYGHSS